MLFLFLGILGLEVDSMLAELSLVLSDVIRFPFMALKCIEDVSKVFPNLALVPALAVVGVNIGISPRGEVPIEVSLLFRAFSSL